jgi:asparagine synthase (glutamine-hydrolysing)
MCGIAGIILNPNQTLPDMQRRLQAMCDAMAHRGPDDSGLYLSPDARVGLVNCRLAIRDLSPSGHMPMESADRSTWITYNGEVYNADALRSTLTDQGYRFRSTSDTEVLLYGYQAWGAAVLDHLRGMFAFALLSVDTLARSNDSTFQRVNVFLARDRLGIKPLYYAQTAEGVVFASELKALVASGLVSCELDPAAVVAYLLLGAVPGPLTIYRCVRTLEPGCSISLALDEQPLNPIIRRYWDLPVDTEEHANPAEVLAEVRALLEEAVRIRLVSDVPLGAFLSGGLDSSTVVALMRAVSDAPIRTCSMVFEEAEYSEAAYAQAVAQAAGTEHYARVITAQDVQDNLDAMLQAMDQPTIDGVNSYFVSQTAREAGLTVALSGLGGDELFGGYPNTFATLPRLLQMLQRAQSVPAAAPAVRLALGMPGMHKRWGKVSAALSRPASTASAYLACRGLFSPGEVQSLVTADAWQEAMQRFDAIEQIAASAPTGQCTNGSLFNWVSRAELRNYTLHQLLRDTDVMSMAHSLEVRVPLLDHRLVEAVLRLPPELKQANGHGPKPLLTRAVADLLPPLVRDRRDKRGFTFPFDVWLRGPLRRNGHAPSAALQGLLRTEQVAQVSRLFAADKIHWSRPWALNILERWASGVRTL